MFSCKLPLLYPECNKACLHKDCQIKAFLQMKILYGHVKRGDKLVKCSSVNPSSVWDYIIQWTGTGTPVPSVCRRLLKQVVQSVLLTLVALWGVDCAHFIESRKDCFVCEWEVMTFSHMKRKYVMVSSGPSNIFFKVCSYLQWVGPGNVLHFDTHWNKILYWD